MPLDTSTIPWIPLSPGFSYKPVRYLPDNGGRILLLRVEPGTVIPRHRHSGEVHGDVEYLDDAGNVLSRTTDASSHAAFEAWRKPTGFHALDLG